MSYKNVSPIFLFCLDYNRNVAEYEVYTTMIRYDIIFLSDREKIIDKRRVKDSYRKKDKAVWRYVIILWKLIGKTRQKIWMRVIVGVCIRERERQIEREDWIFLIISDICRDCYVCKSRMWFYTLFNKFVIGKKGLQPSTYALWRNFFGALTLEVVSHLLLIFF